MPAAKLPLIPGQRSPDVEAYLATKTPEAVAHLLPATREWVWQHLPQVAEGIRWGVIYLHHQGPLFYLDPDRRRPGTLRIGWARGTQLEAPPGWLSDIGADGKPLKMIRVTVLTDPAQLQEEALITLLHQAAQLNELVPIGAFWGNARKPRSNSK